MMLPNLTEHGEALSQIANKDGAACVTPPIEGRQTHWYAVRTCARHEKRVREHLNSRNIECFLPLYESVSRWKNGCTARIERPLFPTYLFVEIDIRERSRVLEIPGILSLVGSGGKAIPLPDFDIQSLRAGLHLRKFEPHPYLVAGQKMRIKSGPLVDLTGVLLRKSGGLRLVLSLDLIQQGVAVEVDMDDVEPVAAADGQVDPYKPAIVPNILN